MYIACVDPSTGEIVGGVNSCSMCKRLIINAGIETVVVRETETEFSVYNVEDWVTDDESVKGEFGY